MADCGVQSYTEPMQRQRGFSILELTVAIGILTILATVVVFGVYRQRAYAKLARVTTELNALAASLAQYAEDNNYQYPADAPRGIPVGLERYMAPGSWPVSIWPKGLFDYDAGLHPGPGANQGMQIYQISYRLCGADDPIESCRDPVVFPNFTRNSAIYYCISGPCVPHFSDITAPAYCVNCKPKEQNY
jgi:prepilin-type N-terminal cleavage/methylation domain-containing protein